MGEVAARPETYKIWVGNDDRSCVLLLRRYSGR